MKFTGRCYCGDIKYQAEGDPIAKIACHCRECQYISGGNSNLTIGMPEATFKYTQGTPTQFTRDDLEQAVTREFCPDCGTQLLTRAPMLPGTVLIKVGTMDNPAEFEGAGIAVYTDEKQPFHQVPEGIPCFGTVPGA